jgi:hypothetical protein
MADREEACFPRIWRIPRLIPPASVCGFGLQEIHRRIRRIHGSRTGKKSVFHVFGVFHGKSSPALVAALYCKRPTAEYAEYTDGGPGRGLFSAYFAYSAVNPSCLCLRFFSYAVGISAPLCHNPLKLDLGIMPKVNQ